MKRDDITFSPCRARVEQGQNFNSLELQYPRCRKHHLGHREKGKELGQREGAQRQKRGPREKRQRKGTTVLQLREMELERHGEEGKASSTYPKPINVDISLSKHIHLFRTQSSLDKRCCRKCNLLWFSISQGLLVRKKNQANLAMATVKDITVGLMPGKKNNLQTLPL